MTQLTEEVVIKLMREEWGKKRLQLEKSLNAFTKSDVPGDPGMGTISAETKVKHKGSQLLYTVQEVAPDELILRTPEGKLFSIDTVDFRDEYELA